MTFMVITGKLRTKFDFWSYTYARNRRTDGVQWTMWLLVGGWRNITVRKL